MVRFICPLSLVLLHTNLPQNEPWGGGVVYNFQLNVPG